MLFAAICAILAAGKSFLAWSLPYECSWIVFRRVSYAFDLLVDFTCETLKAAFKACFEFLVACAPTPAHWPTPAQQPLLEFPEVWFRYVNAGTEWLLHVEMTDIRLAFWTDYWDEPEAALIRDRANRFIVSRWVDGPSANDECRRGWDSDFVERLEETLMWDVGDYVDIV